MKKLYKINKSIPCGFIFFLAIKKVPGIGATIQTVLTKVLQPLTNCLYQVLGEIGNLLTNLLKTVTKVLKDLLQVLNLISGKIRYKIVNYNHLKL